MHGLARPSFLAVCLVSLCTAPSWSDDWPALRGDGSGVASGSLLSGGENVSLKLRWKKRIGSGYSSVVVADGRVIVMYADGKDDVVACLSAETGDSLWKVSVGPTFKGANGSFDGPLSTPLIHAGNVHCLSARGRLVSVGLRSGKVNWERELTEDEAAPLPLYGFTTSPVIAGDTLLLLIGAEKKLMIGVDPASGETRWAAGNDRVASQTPMVFDLNGRKIVLVSAGVNLTGVDPVDGQVLFEVPHGGGNGSAVTPVDIGDGRVLLTVDDSFSTAFVIRANGAKIVAEKAWTDRSIKNTYNIPVVHRDSVFGFSTRILTCVDPQTGKPRWRSRKPGDGFLTVVDGHLVITTKKGSLHIAEASSSRYEEVASIELFNELNWSLPAYADNAIYTRSFGEVARVDLVSDRVEISSGRESVPSLGPKFAAFLQRVKTAEGQSARTRIVDEYLGSQTSFPIAEGKIVHFVYRGPGRDVAVASDLFGARQERRMIRVPGTDLHYYTVKLPEDQRANYVFLVDYDVQADPRNPRKTVSTMYAGEMEFAVRLRNEKPLTMSWFAMPGWDPPAFLSPADGLKRGKVVKHKVPGGDKETTIPIEVCLPPGYASDTSRRYPTVYVHDGLAAREQLIELADAIHSDHANPAILVLLTAQFNPMSMSDPTAGIADYVVPFVDRTYRTIADRTGRSSYGTGFQCAAALSLVARHPELFSAASAQSPLIFDQGREQLAKAYGGVRQPVRVYIEWGRYDMFNPHENWDIRDIGRSLTKALSRNKFVTVTPRQINDSTDWRSWRGQFDKVLQFLVGE